MQLRSPLAIAAERFGRKETLSPILIPTMYKLIDEQLKLSHKVIDVMAEQTN